MIKNSGDNDNIKKVLWYLKQVSSLAEDNSSIGNIASSVITNDVEKMEGKYVFKYSSKRNEKVKTLPTKTSVKLSCKGEATFASDLLAWLFSQTVVILASNDCKDMNWEYIPQHCLDQQFRCKKQKSHL